MLLTSWSVLEVPVIPHQSYLASGVRVGPMPTQCKFGCCSNLLGQTWKRTPSVEGDGGSSTVTFPCRRGCTLVSGFSGRSLLRTAVVVSS